jgi:putative membrane protein
MKLNWKLMLLRVIVNGLALAVIALILPGIRIITDGLLVNLLILGAVMGVLNAIVKPIIQFLTFPILFVSYGLVVVVINAMLLWLLSVLYIFEQRFFIDSIWAALFGGLVFGLLGIFLENLLGMTPPLVDDTVPEGSES